MFRLPVFYMPWAARCNAHLDASRTASRAWAHDAGMLGPDAVWDEATFYAADYARFTAFGHPDAAPGELELLTEWYVWLFYLDDDFCARYKRTGDLAGARAYVTRLRALLATNATTTPIAETIVERALADLWARTVPTASAEWCARFAASNERIFEEFVSELTEHGEERIANPLEYVEMRRGTGGTPWSADLVEHALGCELAPALHDSRPIRVVRDVFADTVGLHNDIVSYEKEMRAGEHNNGVHIVQRFLGCELQEAVDVVDAIITSRLHQFEHTVLTELGPLLDETGLGPLERSTALRFVGGLQDWMAGDRAWHRISGRYGNAGQRSAPSVLPPPFVAGPTGLGTAAARIATVRPPPARLWAANASPPSLPAPYMPFAARLNPQLAAAREHGRDWALRMGLLDGSVWDERRFDAIDCARLSALTHPDASLDELLLIDGFNTWGFYVDDLVVELFKRGRPLGPGDLAAARAMVARLPALMPIDRTSDPAPAPVGAHERALADLWSRLPADHPEPVLRGLAADIVATFEGVPWELANLAQGRVPDAVDYVEMRRPAISGSSTYLGRYVQSSCELLPDELVESRPMRELLLAHADWHGLFNDLVSYERECAYERDPNTGVLVLGRLLNCDEAVALSVLNDLVTSRVRQFERIVAVDLEPLLDQLAVDEPTRRSVLAYVRGLEDSMAGAHVWSRETGRYARAPWTGTAAARVGRRDLERRRDRASRGGGGSAEAADRFAGRLRRGAPGA